LSIVKVFAAIVLLLWAVCYGRCLTDQYGGTETSEQGWCELQCCQSDQPEIPPHSPVVPCGVCEFIKSGIVLPSDGIHLAVPQLIFDAGIELDWLFDGELTREDDFGETTASMTGPPLAGRMCEWMARTAAPVRGPNA
jgi:hypothetical protein